MWIATNDLFWCQTKTKKFNNETNTHWNIVHLKRTNGIEGKDERGKKWKWNGYVVDISIYVFTINSVRYVGVGRFVSFSLCYLLTQVNAWPKREKYIGQCEHHSIISIIITIWSSKQNNYIFYLSFGNSLSARTHNHLLASIKKFFRNYFRGIFSPVSTNSFIFSCIVRVFGGAQRQREHLNEDEYWAIPVDVIYFSSILFRRYCVVHTLSCVITSKTNCVCVFSVVSMVSCGQFFARRTKDRHLTVTWKQCL